MPYQIKDEKVIHGQRLTKLELVSCLKDGSIKIPL